MFTPLEKQYLLNLARESIGFSLRERRLYQVEPANLTPTLLEKRATFVTLTAEGLLRGCIGHLEAINPLYRDVIENAVAAAFQDPRFPPVVAFELEEIGIGISVLTPTQKLLYEGHKDLIQKLKPLEHGVILKKGGRGATFLPQVWEQIKDPEDFLCHLCAKAGLEPKEWKKGNLDVLTYTVESFEESEMKS